MTAQVYAHLRIWDGVADGYLDGADAIRVEDGRIAAIGTAAEISADAATRDMHGATVLPGLIDAHVHMVLDPDLRDPLSQTTADRETRASAMARRAAGMVRAGITTARDLGGGEWLELALRDRIARGEIEGPRLVCAGQPVTSPGGHCHFWGGEATGTADAAAVIGRQHDHGVDLIKVMATGGSMTKGSKPREAQFDSAVDQSFAAFVQTDVDRDNAGSGKNDDLSPDRRMPRRGNRDRVCSFREPRSITTARIAVHRHR